jgi:hypothetical protein
MIRTQIQLTPEQTKILKRLAAREKKSVSELIRLSVDAMIRSNVIPNQADARQRALAAAGFLKGPVNLAVDHDDYLSEAYSK